MRFFHAVIYGGFFILRSARGKPKAARPGKVGEMSEEKKEVIENGEPHGDTEKDYKAMYEQAIAESRKWESRSKANADKAKKYDELESAKKTLEERVASIEATNKALEDEKARAALVKFVSESTGVPESIVSSLSATDEDALTTQAKAIADNYKLPGGAPKVTEAGKFPKDEQDSGDMRKFAHELFSSRR